MLSNQFVEALKEFLRVALAAVIPVIIDGALAGALDLRFVGITAAVAFLRAVDKYLHELGKSTPLDLHSLDGLKG